MERLGVPETSPRKPRDDYTHACSHTHTHTQMNSQKAKQGNKTSDEGAGVAREGPQARSPLGPRQFPRACQGHLTRPEAVTLHCWSHPLGPPGLSVALGWKHLTPVLALVTHCSSLLRSSPCLRVHTCFVGQLFMPGLAPLKLCCARDVLHLSVSIPGPLGE